MPRLERDGPEALQALKAIRQDLEPLIAKRIQDDTKKIENLAVSNSRSFFKYELNLILLNLKKEQDLLPDDYNSFLDDLHRIFQLLDGLIDEQVLHPSITSLDASTQEESPTSGYPKLEALLKRASDKSTSSDLSTLLRLPETEEKSKEAEQTVTEFNAKNLTRSNTETRQDVGDINPVNKSYHREMSKSTSRPELESVKQSQKCLSSLFDALVENMSQSNCGFSHIAKLQIRDPTGSCESNDGVQHKMFVSCCLFKDKWQETTCHVVPQLTPSSPKLKGVRSICKAIGASINNERTLELLVHASRILHSPKSPNIIKCPPVWPTVSLEDILASEKVRFSQLDKVILGLNLSRALLRMYNSGMQSKDWTAENIFFLFDSQEEYVYEAYNPYFVYSLLRVQRSDNAEQARPRKFSVLVTFAKLLWEIALGRRILGPFNRPLDIYLLALINPAEGEESDESEVTNNMVVGYVDAVCACLEANKRGSDDEEDDDDDDEESDSEVLDEESQCRAVLFRAIAYLEEARTTVFKHPRDPNYPLKLKVPRTVQSRGNAKKLNNLPATNLSSPSLSTPSNNTTNLQVVLPTNSLDTVDKGFPKQLFDVRRIGFSVGDMRLFWAEDFLNRAEEFYNNHISDLSNDRKIRIAILDTGIDETDVFFRGVLWTRNKRDGPFKKKVSFVGAPNEYGDIFGHGTNVAHLILKVAPEADLYIAKISQGQEQEGEDLVVKAIKWARSFNVDIINMSFAFLGDQTDIKEAIEDAENDGVIIFAAASNYGRHGGRKFPAKLDKVLCLHASDGNGNKSGMDPSPKQFSENLTTLGVAIPSIWEKGVYLTGTSYSTPVAVGIAANVLRFVEHVAKEGLLTEEQRNEAFSRTGMRKILVAMSDDGGDGYQFVAPWRKMWDEGSSMGDIVSKIKQALKE